MTIVDSLYPPCAVCGHRHFGTCCGVVKTDARELFRFYRADGGLQVVRKADENAVWPEGEGRKDDGGKDPWRLLPWDAVRAIVKVLAFGAGKYSERNWEKGMDWSRPFDACIRHLTSWWEGEKADPETGMSHLWHAGCCVLFLIAYELRSIGQDNRPAPRKDT